MSDRLVVRGAREHNLQDVSIELPREKLIVFTGLSGSGKSSLAFDTIYAEGQRRYVESLSAYARQFLGQMDKPDVDFIEGLSPAISIDQKSASRNPRSTVGTITEIYDYLRLLYARVGIPHCPKDGSVVSRQTPQQIVDRVLTLPEGSRVPGAGARRAGPQGRVREPLRGARRPGLREGACRRHDLRALRDPEVGPLRGSHHRGRGRPARAAPGHRAPAHRLPRDRAQAGRRRRRGAGRAALRAERGTAWTGRPARGGRCRSAGRGGRGGGRCRDAHLFPAPCLPGVRRLLRRAGAAQFLVQLPLWRLPAAATASARATRSTPSSSCRTRTCRSTTVRWRPGAVRAASTSRGSLQGVAETFGILDLAAVAEAQKAGPEGGPLRLGRDARCTCTTRTATAGRARTTRTTRAWSPTCSGATPRPSPTACASR